MNIASKLALQSSPVQEVCAIDAESFKKNHLDKKIPVVLKGFANNWVARQKWDLEFFLNQEEDKSINILEGDYIQNDKNFKTVRFKEFIRKLKDGDLNSEKNKQYITALNLFHYYPDLKNDADFSIFSQFTKFNLKLAWIGPKGTISGFHADNVNNMFAQIHGRKLFFIASNGYNRKMYPSNKYIPGATASAVDINNFEESQFPKFWDVPIKKVILEPGDVLFLPKGWWHYVEALDTSISINNFGYSKKEKYTIALIEHIKDYLHRKGLFKPNNCMCHKKVNGKRVSSLHLS